MTSIRIDNKENNGPSEPIKGIAMAAQQQRRAGLSQRSTTNTIVPKQPLGNSNRGCKNIILNQLKNIPKDNKDIICGKENRKNIVNPIVPVAQFEAFKVYEDNNYEEKVYVQAEQKPKHVNKIKPQVCNENKNDRIRKEVMEIEREILSKKQEDDLCDKDESDVHISSPMSVENSLSVDENQPPQEQPRSSRKCDKDIFFEMVEYRDDIYRYLRKHELSHRPKAGYMKKQPDITSNMRTILVDWLVEVGEEYTLNSETLYLAVNYIDRFLSYMSVVVGKLQLVGTAAMFLASKYEEIYPPHISEFVYITDDTYSVRQVIRMEHLILKVLHFDLSIPTSLTFITAICVINNLPEQTKFLAMYLSELALLNGDLYLEFLPSVIASSAVALAQYNLTGEAWDSGLEESTGYKLGELNKCVEFLNQMFKMAPEMKQHASYNKYRCAKYKFVSKIKPCEKPINFD